MDFMAKLTALVFVALGFIVITAGVGLLMAFPIMWCWNYAVVAVWKLPAITWGQAWCLNFLAYMFIKASAISSGSKSK